MCLGISGSGKSTRLLQFLRFLMVEKKLQLNEYLWNGKKIGYTIEELKFFVFGNVYESSGYQRFQGLDNVTGTIGSSALISEVMKEINDKGYTQYVEGSGVTDSFRFRPKFLCEEINPDNLEILFFLYKDDEEGKKHYFDRIMYRSGKVPGESMWSKNRAYCKTVGNCEEEMKSVTTPVKLHVHYYDAPVDIVGITLLESLGRSEWTSEFVEFCKKDNYISINKFDNWIKKPVVEKKSPKKTDEVEYSLWD